MTKKLCTTLLSAFITVSALAQTECTVKECASFAPKKGQWEVSLMLGKSNAFYNENNSYLLPNITAAGGNIGLPNGGVPGSDGTASGYLNQYLNIDGFNGNSLVNILGVQGKYFWQDCWAVSFSGGMNIGITPKKDYIESTPIMNGVDGYDNINLPAAKYINATATNNWFVNVGIDRYFKTKNKRIFPYVGATVGYQMARVETREPYTGNMVSFDGVDVDQQVYVPAGKIGQMFGIKAAATAGVEYNFMEGFFLALEIQPLAYRYDVIQIAPQGFDHYNLNHHNIKILDMPMLRVGFRF